MRSFISLLAAVSLVLLSAACGRLPSGAPVSEEILAQSIRTFDPIWIE